MALALRTEYLAHTVGGLWMARTAADRVQRLREHAGYFLSRGNGRMAKIAATGAREIGRAEFSSAVRRCRVAGLEQRGPAGPVGGVIDLGYDGNDEPERSGDSRRQHRRPKSEGGAL